MRKLFIGAMMLLLSACVTTLNPSDFETRADYDAAVAQKEARIQALRVVAVSQLALWMPAPSQMDEGQLTRGLAVCSVAILGAAAIDPEHGISPITAQWCRDVSDARAVLKAKPAPQPSVPADGAL